MTQDQFTNQKQESKKRFQELTAQCMFLDKKPSYISAQEAQELKDKLENIWSIFCEIYSKATTRWTVDPQFKGYLLINSSSCKILVPYHFADYFPQEEALEEFRRIASAVIVSSDGVICLSGSSTYLQALEYIADIDYCEYAPFDKSDDRWRDLLAYLKRKILGFFGKSDGWRDKFVQALREATKKQDNKLACLIGNIFDSDNNTIHTIIPHNSNPPHFNQSLISHGKLDFISQFLEDIIEVTNVVLPIDRDNSQLDSTLEKSFALQEAPITEGSWIPQTLLDPLSLGKYANFLKEQVEKKQESDPIKAAKRALALARITGFWEQGNSIIDVLVRDNFTRSAALKARRSLEPILSNLQQRNPPVDENFLNQVQSRLRHLGSEHSSHPSRDDSIKVLQEIFKTLLNNIEQTIKKVKPND